MFWMLLVLVHVVVYLLLRKEESDKRDIEKRIHGPFISIAPNRFPECENEAGYYDPDREERAKIAKRNREAVDEIDSDYVKVGALRELNKL